MIVTPDFLEHWKSRLLAELTGDESSPLAVLRLWAHCQNSKRGFFPDMTSSQLSSICRWGSRKPAAHVALVKAGFVDKLTPKGFAAHDWAEHNRQLIQKWEAGQNGGRPQKAEKANESASNGKPTDNRPTTARELDRTDGPEQTDRVERNRTEGLDALEKIVPSGKEGFGSVPILSESLVPVQSLVQSVTQKVSPRPTLAEITAVMKAACPGGEKYAAKWAESMAQQNWLDHKGGKIKDWKRLAVSFANGCARRELGV